MEDEMANRGWRGVVEAAKGGWLLGGTKRHESSVFTKESDAWFWCAAVETTNKAAGRAVSAVRVVEVR